MAEYSNLILELIPQNALTSDICRMKENCRRLWKAKSSLALALTFTCPPKNLKTGFAFGHDEQSCDIVFKESELNPRHFNITHNLESGLLLLVNRSESGIIVGKTKLYSVNQSVVLEHLAVIHFGSYRFKVNIPNRGCAQDQFINNQSLYLGFLLFGTPGAVYCKYTTPRHEMKRVGPYLEISQLGRGAFGEVSVLCTSDTGDIYVAKKLRGTISGVSIRQEARTLRRLSSVCTGILFKSLDQG